MTFARSIIYGRRESIGPRGKYEMPRQVDYNLFLGPAADVPLTRPNLHYDWHWVWNTGNGELGNNNIHIVDICRWLMGLDGLGDSVLSFGGRLGYEDAGETPNTQMVVHTFGRATIVQEVRGLKTDPFSPKFRAGHVIHGTEGFIAESSLFDRDGNLVRTFEGRTENHFANFIKAVRNGRRGDLNADIREGHQSSALCHVGNISHRLGRPERVEVIARRLEDSKLDAEAGRTFERMTRHLRDNGVDLERNQLCARSAPAHRFRAGSVLGPSGRRRLADPRVSPPVRGAGGGSGVIGSQPRRTMAADLLPSPRRVVPVRRPRGARRSKGHAIRCCCKR